MKKGAEAFRSIGEVAKLIGVAPHVLRYWETQFPQLKPMKRPDGRRYYRPEDVRLAAGLCEVLREEGLTIRGARKMLARDRGETVRARGAERIGDLMGAALADAMAAGPLDTSAGAGVMPVTGNQNLSQPSQLAEIDTDPLSEEDSSEMASHSPKARHRHRRRGGSGGGSLPLFPDLDPAPGSSAWLASLVNLSAMLHRLGSRDPRLRHAHPHLSDLRDAIAMLY